jgi:Zn-dependent M28 family amino/carboxypeptidase
MAALFIDDQFRINQVPPFFESYRDTLSNFEGVAFNVVGWVEGQDPVLKNEYILIGAHYDHIGVVPAQSMDSIANGANDNASGTTTVLELARYFGNTKSNGRSLIFALFSAEEKGLLGSFHLAKKLKQQGLPLYLMLNFEMTGVPLQDKDYLAYVTGYGLSNMAEVINRHAGEKVVGFLPSAEQFNLFQRSDHSPFHLEFGIPSQTFCTFDFTNFDHYHKVGDEVQLMDMEHMSEFVNTFIPIVEKISKTVEREITY